MQVGKPRSKTLEPDTQFKSCEVLAHTLMDAKSKGQMIPSVPAYVQLIWILELRRVTIRCGKRYRHALAFGNHASGDIDISYSRPLHTKLQDGQIPKKLLYGLGDQGGFLAQTLPLIAVCDKREGS